jgi:hypothetical protein
MEFIKGLFKGIGFGLLGMPALYVLAQVIDLIGCFFTCGNMACFSEKSCAGKLGMYSGDAALAIFLFCTIAGAVIGIIYGIVKEVQEGDIIAKNAAQKRRIENGINSANTEVRKIKNKSDDIVSLIKNAEKTVFSTKAKKILEEAAAEANKVDLALGKAFKTAEDAKGKSSNGALKNAQLAEDSARWSQKDIDTANDLYRQAMKEEQDWNLLQKEANNAVDKARNAADNAEKETAKIQGKSFASAAQDAVGKATYALTKVKEAAAETIRRKEAAEKATSTDDAEIEVIWAKNSEKRALVEEKIAVEATRIALAAG